MNTKDFIKTRRSELGLTLSQVSEKVGITMATLQRYECGEIDICNVHLSKIEKLAKALKTSPAHLMGWDDKPNISLNLSDEEKELLKLFRDATEKGKGMALGILMSSQEDIKKGA